MCDAAEPDQAWGTQLSVSCEELTGKRTGREHRQGGAGVHRHRRC